MIWVFLFLPVQAHPDGAAGAIGAIGAMSHHLHDPSTHKNKAGKKGLQAAAS